MKSLYTLIAFCCLRTFLSQHQAAITARGESPVQSNWKRSECPLDVPRLVTRSKILVADIKKV